MVKKKTMSRKIIKVHGGVPTSADVESEECAIRVLQEIVQPYRENCDVMNTNVSGNSLRKSAICLNSQQLATPGPLAEQKGESINREAESRQNVQSDRSCIDEARQHLQQGD